MRSDENAWLAPQFVIVGKRLGIGDVESGADSPGRQFDDEGIGVDDTSPRDIDEERSILHRAEEGGVDKSASRVIQRYCENHHIGNAYDAEEFRHGNHARALRPSDHRHLHLEGLKSPVQRLPEAPGSYDHDVAVRESRSVGVLPPSVGHAPRGVVDSSKAREDQPDREFCRARIVDSDRVAEQDTVWQVGTNVVVTRGQQLTDLKVRHLAHLREISLRSHIDRHEELSTHQGLLVNAPVVVDDGSIGRDRRDFGWHKNRAHRNTI